MKISIAAALGWISLVAIALASALYPTEFWSSAIYSSTLAVLGTAILGALFRRGPVRAFWAGLAIVGWGYLNFSLNLSLYDYVNQYPYARDIRPQLLTTRLIDRLYERAASLSRRTPGQQVYVVDGPQTPGQGTATFEEEKNGLYRLTLSNRGPTQSYWVKPSQVRVAEPRLYQYTGHSLLALFLGLAGGFVARGFVRRQERENAQPARVDLPSPRADGA